MTTERAVAIREDERLPPLIAVDSSLPTSLRWLTSDEYSPRLVIGWLPSGWVPPPEVPEEDVPAIEAGIKAVTAQLRRATTEEVAGALSEMAVVLRTRDQLTAKAAVRLYARHLGDIPASVLKMACDHWVRTEEWFPAIAEVRKWCEARGEDSGEPAQAPLHPAGSGEESGAGRRCHLRLAPRDREAGGNGGIGNDLAAD